MIIGNLIGIGYNRGGQGYSDAAEIAAGNALLLDSARAYWDFTTLEGNEDDAITSVSDLTGNGWTLGNNGGTLTPKLGKVLSGTTSISCLKATTPLGDESAMLTTAPATNLCKGSFEVFITMVLTDGQHPTTQFLLGGGSGSTQIFDVKITATGGVQVRYAANAGSFSTLDSTAGIIPNGVTGIVLLRLRMDFVNDVITAYVNGVPYVLSVSSGNAVSAWNPDAWVLANPIGIGGRWGGTEFANDAAGTLKNLLKVSFTELLADDEALNVSLAMLDI